MKPKLLRPDSKHITSRPWENDLRAELQMRRNAAARVFRQLDTIESSIRSMTEQQLIEFRVEICDELVECQLTLL